MALSIKPLPAPLGAQVSGLDLGRPQTPETVAALRAAWSRHGVLVFRGQAISDASHAAFARHFSALPCTATEVYRSANTDEAGRPLPFDHELARLARINWHWHADGCYRAQPHAGVLLRCLEAAPEGGDTFFADLCAAHDALAPALQRRLATLNASHSFVHMVGVCGLPAMGADEAARWPAVEHPLVRAHADGRRSLFLSPPYMAGIAGLPVELSRALLAELSAWAAQPRFVYGHRWQPGDLLLWDNRWTMHRVTPYDMAHHRRVMHGSTLLGNEAVRAVGEAGPAGAHAARRVTRQAPSAPAARKSRV